ncbi:deoxyhypusine synthase-like protein [Terfezia claveryi]|nr:deoxyhypusine synthase-like protein [Terfezia claveryi]
MPSPARLIPSSSPHSLTAFPPPPSPTPSPAQPAPLCLAPVAPPTSATGAVLVQSAPIPPQWKSRIVHGLDFNDFAGKPVTASDLVSGMSRMGFQASNVSTACQLIDEMRTWRDPETSEPATIFLGYTSNLVSSGLRETLRYLVEHKHVSAIVTTAGGIEEDIIKCLAPTYLGSFSLDGATLRSQGLNRIGNLLVPNNNYCAFEDWVMPLLDTLLAEQTASQNDTSIPAEEKLVWTPSAVIARLGKEINNEKSILYWAWKNSIPIFCPALTDGSLGDMLYFHSFRASPGRLVIDIVRDIRNINSIAVRAKAAGMWAVIVNVAGEFDGSDAGARPDEAVSWGKIKPVGDGRGGRGMVKVYAEATVVFPLIVAATWARHQQEEEEKKKVNVDAAVNGVVDGDGKV